MPGLGESEDEERQKKGKSFPPNKNIYPTNQLLRKTASIINNQHELNKKGNNFIEGSN